VWKCSRPSATGTSEGTRKYVWGAVGAWRAGVGGRPAGATGRGLRNRVQKSSLSSPTSSSPPITLPHAASTRGRPASPTSPSTRSARARRSTGDRAKLLALSVVQQLLMEVVEHSPTTVLGGASQQVRGDLPWSHLASRPAPHSYVQSPCPLAAVVDLPLATNSHLPANALICVEQFQILCQRGRRLRGGEHRGVPPRASLASDVTCRPRAMYASVHGRVRVLILTNARSLTHSTV